MDARKQRREAILDAAMEIVESRRTTSFTMDEVAERAGVARVTIYRYFKGKKELLRKLADERNASFKELVFRDTRDRILDAAESVITSSGVRGATVYEIADQAGLGAATVYRHFGDRDRLMGAWVRERTPRKVLGAGLVTGESKNFRRDLEEVTADTLRLVQNKGELLQLLASEHPERPELLEVFVRAQSKSAALIRDFFQKQIDAGTFAQHDPTELAIAYLGMIVTFGWLAPMLGARVRTEDDLAQFIVDLFLDGAGAE